MKTKTLSAKRKERICCNTCDKGENIKHYLDEDVKEFIKDILDCANYEDDWATRDYIKKRAGDKLI